MSIAHRVCGQCGQGLSPGDNSQLCPACALETRVDGSEISPEPAAANAAESEGPPLPAKIGAHEILSVVGEGGMGTVYLARDPILDRQVALKVLRPELLNPDFADRHTGEAIVTGRLAHPGIVPVHQLGVDEKYGPWYTMKLVQGRPFSDVLQGLRERRPEDEEAYTLPVLLGIFQRVCEALAFAHHNQVVHRDIKPGNIMLGEFGEVMVLDWGLARVLDQPTKTRPAASNVQMEVSNLDSSFTRDGIVIGTPGYMSPEQAAGLGTSVGPPSDVYSLGAILYEILTLQPPVDVNDANEAIRATLEGEIVPVQKRGVGRQAPRALCQIVEKAMGATPEIRYPSAMEMARAIDDFIAGRVPWRSAQEERGAEAWDVVSGRWSRRADDLYCLGGQSSRVVHESRLGGDVRITFTLIADVDRTAWEADLWLALRGGFSLEGYQIRLAAGPEGRVELLRHGVVAVRRLDVHLASRARYHMLVLREGDRLSITINGTRVLEYRDLFPLRGDRVALSCDDEGILFRDVHLQGRGAPLQLTFLALPDKIFQLGQVREARDLYLEMAETHPDREEGHLAQYKAALCSIELGDRAAAEASLRNLEGTVLEALIPLGYAKLGLKAGKPAVAVAALTDGCQKYPGDPIRIELWTLLLDTIDGVERESPDVAAQMFHELLRQRWLDPGEAVQVCAEALRLGMTLGGPARVRDEAMKLLAKEPYGVEVRMECHGALARAGMTPDLIPRCREALQETLALGLNLAARDRWMTMLRLSETLIAEGDLRAARHTLSVVFGGAAHPSNEGAWARNWLALVSLLEGNPAEALAVLDREAPAYINSKSIQELFKVLIECAALGAMGQAEESINRLAEATVSIPEWQPIAGVVAGQEPLEVLWGFATGLSPNLAAELYLLLGEIFAGRKKASIATQLRARAIQISAGRALALWFVSRRTIR